MSIHPFEGNVIRAFQPTAQLSLDPLYNGTEDPVMHPLYVPSAATSPSMGGMSSR